MVGGGALGQFLIPSPETLKSQIPISGGRGSQPTFDAKSICAKILNSHFWDGWVGVCVGGACGQFDAKSRNAKIPNSHFHFWGRWVGEGGTWDAWNLVLPPNVHLGWTTRFWHKILQHILSQCITDSSLRKLITWMDYYSREWTTV